MKLLSTFFLIFLMATNTEAAVSKEKKSLSQKMCESKSKCTGEMPLKERKACLKAKRFCQRERVNRRLSLWKKEGIKAKTKNSLIQKMQKKERAMKLKLSRLQTRLGQVKELPVKK